MIDAYHFVGDTLRSGDPVPADGAWLEVSGPLILCEHGLHASRHPFDALKHAPGPILCRVQLEGDILEEADKLVATRRRIVRRIDSTDLCRHFARACARDVLHLWDALPVVRQYLETGDETLRGAACTAAEAAARASAWDAARVAARAATWVATRATAITDYRQQFADLVIAAFQERTS